MKALYARALDKLFSRWGNVAFNIGVTALFAGLALLRDPGFGREFLWFMCGTQSGFAAFWLCYPRFTAARRREVETEMALIISGAVARANAVCGTDFQEITPPPDGDTKH